MVLPVIDRPIYKTNILSRKDPVQFVPFTVRESKILLMAKESDSLDDMVNALTQILSNCLVDKFINVKDLPMVDMEWLFLQIQAKSSGEKTPLFFKCVNKVNDNECGMVIEFEVDLLKVGIQNKDVNRKIMISDNIGLMMKLPTYEMTKLLANTETLKMDQTLAALCIEYVFTDNEIYYSNTATQEEMVEFVETIPLDKYESIEKYFDNCPVIKSVQELTCPKCGFKHEITLEGLEDFFV